VIEQLGLATGPLQAVDQALPVQALFDTVSDQSTDLPGGQAQGRQHDHRQQPPTLLQRMTAGHQQQPCRQQAGHGETEESRKADAIGDAGGDDDRTDQTVQQRLRGESIGGYQRDHCIAQADRTYAAAEKEPPAPVRIGLPLGASLAERHDLLQPQQAQREHPADPAAEFDAAVVLPQHHAADQRREQQQQRRDARPQIEQTRAFGNVVGGRHPICNSGRSPREGGSNGIGHVCCSSNNCTRIRLSRNQNTADNGTLLVSRHTCCIGDWSVGRAHRPTEFRHKP